MKSADGSPLTVRPYNFVKNLNFDLEEGDGRR